jgi:KDO2-lipid IV(A) lauroyltransferase
MLAERFSHYLETLYEFANPGSCVAINSKEFDQFMADNTDPEKGALAVTAHLGNWELMGKFMTVAVPSRTCLMLAKENKYAEVSRLTERIRLGMDMQVLFVSEKSGIKSIMKNLHKDTLIGLVADQKSAGRAGPRAQFFGLETDFVSGPQRLAMKFSLPLLLCYAIRTGPLRYQILFTRLESTSSDSLESFTQSMAAEFESSIRKHPTQWTWDYKKWLL